MMSFNLPLPAHIALCDFIDILALALTHIVTVALDQKRLYTDELIISL